MPAPAARQGDRITGTCIGHQIPSASGSAPAPPMPFSAPLTTGLAGTVRIGGRPAAVVGSGGASQPPHAGLHASDRHQSPTQQKGEVRSGSTTVRFDGSAAASAASSCTMCMGPASALATTQSTVMVG